LGSPAGRSASFFLASGLGGVLAGRLMDRVDARLIMILRACVSAIALGCTVPRRWPHYCRHIAKIRTLMSLINSIAMFGG
jgi:MFS family permease